jgi:hypothetical protein
MSYQFANQHQYSDDCDCSICDQYAEENGLFEDSQYEEYYDPNECQVACGHACACCEEVVVPEEYKAQPTEIVGGSSYICGGRRVKKVKRRKHRGKGLSYAKGYKKRGGAPVIGGRRRTRRSHRGRARKH